MKEISSKRDPLQIEKSDVLATMLFCDVKAFTKFTSSITSSQVIERLKISMGIMTEVLKENHGTLAKFIGDALFAYWLAEEQPNHASLACQFASSLRERVSAASFEFATHTGIHTGRVALVSIEHGNYYSLEPIGDAVNLASRLNGACATYNVQAIASEQVIKHVPAVVGWKNLGLVTVKGRTDPVTLYGLT